MAEEDGVTAQDAEDDLVTQDPAAKALRLERIKAEDRLKAAEAERALLETQIGPFDAGAPEGKIDVGDKTGLVSNLLAHTAMEAAAGWISRRVRAEVRKGTESEEAGKGIEDPAKKETVRVLIVESRALAADSWPLEVVKKELLTRATRLEELRRQLKAETGASPRHMVRSDLPQPDGEDGGTEDATNGAAATVAPAAVAAGASALGLVVGSVTSLLSLFRSNYSITGNDVTIDGTALVAALTEGLLSGADPIPTDIDGFTGLENSALIRSFWEAWRKRTEVDHLRLQLLDRLRPVDIRLEDLREALKVARSEYLATLKDKASTATLTARMKRNVDDLRSEVEAAYGEDPGNRWLSELAGVEIKGFDAFAASITSASADAPVPHLVRAALREQWTQRQITHVLFASVGASGGEMVTRQRLIADPTVSYLGGCQVSYLLRSLGEDKIVSAGTAPMLARLEYKLGDENTLREPIAVVDLSERRKAIRGVKDNERLPFEYGGRDPGRM